MSNLLRLVACLFFLLSFNAFAVDTDGDGFSDADEATLGTDPNDPNDPKSPLENKITASDGGYGFGGDIAHVADTAIITKPWDSLYAGAAYVFFKDGPIWIEQQKLTASDSYDGLNFGHSVDFDGDTVVIGAYGLSNNYTGAAYVFVKDGSSWIEQAKLLPPGNFNEYEESLFGESVAVSGDTIFVGARLDDEKGNNAGAAYVFQREGSSWSFYDKLTAVDGSDSDYFGCSIALEEDIVLIGAYGDDDNGSNSGSAYVYARSNGVWSEQAKLTTSDSAANDWFGLSLDLSGETAVISGEDNSSYVFSKEGSAWNQEAKFTTEPNPLNNTISIYDNRIIVGTFKNNTDLSAAYVYKKMDDSWFQEAILSPIDQHANDCFSCSISFDGNIALVTGDGGYQATAVYSFEFYIDSPASISGKTSATLNQGSATFGTLIAIDDDGLTDGTYFSIKSHPAHGLALIDPSSGTWTYIADSFYAGFDPFTIKVTDDLGGTTEQIINILSIGPDSDNDGVFDYSDNCLDIPNPDQSDIDADGVGDFCEVDSDQDGVDDNNNDNCPNTPNTDQANLDGDAFGDACDSDIDGDGVDNTLDAFPNDSTESSDSDSDNVGDNTDNCINAANFDQSDIDSDTLGDACDADMDGDGVFNVVELRFGGNEADNTDASVTQNNIVAFSETAPADSDLDGVPDDVEAMLGEDNTSSTFQDLLDTLSTIATAKNVPAMGGIGLLALGLSMLGLGAVRLRRK